MMPVNLEWNAVPSPTNEAPVFDGHNLDLNELWFQEAEGKDSDDSQNVPNINLVSAVLEDLDEMPAWLTQSGSQPNFLHNLIYAPEIPAQELTVSPSPSASSTTSGYFFAQDETEGAQCAFTEKELRELSVKDINRLMKVKGLTKEEISLVKQRRRTLKNRSYAQNSRMRRIENKKDLQSSNESLFAELQRVRDELEATTRERDSYKNKFEKLKTQLARFPGMLMKITP